MHFSKSGIHFFKQYVPKWQWLKIYFVSAVLALFFISGMLVGIGNLAPAIWLKDGVLAFQDWAEHYQHYSGLRPDKFIRKARPSLRGSGVVIYDKVQAYPGVTLITSMWGDYRNGADLIDMDGKVLHQWRVSYNQIWADTPGFPASKIRDWDVDIHGALLYPDGSMVFNFEYGGLVKIDQCSRVIWKLARETHHSVKMDDDGNLWVPARKMHQKADARFPILKTGIEEDLILKVSPDGKVIREIPVLSAIYKSDLAGLVLGVKNADSANTLTDIGHLNSIDVLSPRLAHQFPMFSAGDILISLRNLNLLIVLDSTTEKVKWWTMGSFAFQHDAHFMDDGRIGLLDNRGEVENPLGVELLGSRILAINPATKQEAILYRSGSDNFFHTPIRGKQQFLPNGNILITEWAAGRVFEVDKNGRVVWNYLNRYDEDEMYIISQATRYDASYAHFAQGGLVCPKP